MLMEIRRRGILFVGLHTSGDQFSEQYALRWLTIMRSTSRVRYCLYGRSWRVPAIEAVLRQMALLANAKVWYSTDADAMWEAELPANVRTAYLQSTPDLPAGPDLVFRTKAMLSQPRFQLPMVVCPNDTLQGRRNVTTCGGCGFCFDD
jgi:hypothetical protein